MTSTAIKPALSNLVAERGHVTFVEMLRLIPEAKGDQEMALANYPNIVLWSGVSNSLMSAISELTAEGKIHLHPATALTYLADGSIPSLPEAKGLKQYKTRHWLPVCFHHSPYKPGS